MRRILVGTLIRNRRWVLPEFFAGLKALDITDCDVKFYVIVQDKACGIMTPIGVFENWMSDVWDIPIKGECLPDPGPNIPITRPWSHKQYVYLTRLRNLLAERASQTGRDLLSVDSDVIPAPDVLQRLIKADKDIVSALVNNHPVTQAFNAMWLDGDRFHRDGAGDLHNKGLIQCDLTGACYLIKHKVLAAGVRYEADKHGEDAGFCLNVKKAGFECWCDTEARTVHRYAEDKWLT